MSRKHKTSSQKQVPEKTGQTEIQEQFFLKNDKCGNKPNCKTENETQQNWKKREPESDSHHDCRSAESWKIGTGCPASDEQVYRVRNLLFPLQDFNPI